MYAIFGNDKAKVGVRDPKTDEVSFENLDGQRETIFQVVEGTSMAAAFADIASAMRTHHLQDGESPTWVESDSPGLLALLQEEFGITASKGRPKAWGDKSLGLTTSAAALVGAATPEDGDA